MSTALLLCGTVHVLLGIVVEVQRERTDLKVKIRNKE